MPMTPEELAARRAAANPPKDRESEFLSETGQEEVFSRTEVETGRIEHAAGAGAHGRAPDGRSVEELLRDERQTERQAPEDAGPGEAAGS
jgi:hypothetical protein